MGGAEATDEIGPRDAWCDACGTAFSRASHRSRVHAPPPAATRPSAPRCSVRGVGRGVRGVRGAVDASERGVRVLYDDHLSASPPTTTGDHPGRTRTRAEPGRTGRFVLAFTMTTGSNGGAEASDRTRVEQDVPVEAVDARCCRRLSRGTTGAPPASLAPSVAAVAAAGAPAEAAPSTDDGEGGASASCPMRSTSACIRRIASPSSLPCSAASPAAAASARAAHSCAIPSASHISASQRAATEEAGARARRASAARSSASASSACSSRSMTRETTRGSSAPSVRSSVAGGYRRGGCSGEPMLVTGMAEVEGKGAGTHAPASAAARAASERACARRSAASAACSVCTASTAIEP
mmetsp:Transcript_10674/g.27734  ORF Transcript_10674/g.27734 Transcript_10674/m.27734 type:complete len:353 (-) Transcript_10674:568-1626(-)